MINYEDFLKVGEAAGDKCRSSLVFTCQVFQTTYAIKFIWRHFKILLFNYLRINSLVHKSLLKYYYLWRELENCEHQKYFCNVIVLQEESQSGIMKTRQQLHM